MSALKEFAKGIKDVKDLAPWNRTFDFVRWDAYQIGRAVGDWLYPDCMCCWVARALLVVVVCAFFVAWVFS